MRNILGMQINKRLKKFKNRTFVGVALENIVERGARRGRLLTYPHFLTRLGFAQNVRI